MAKVVHLRQQQNTALGNIATLDGSFTAQVRALINHHMRLYIQSGGKINRLALRANLTHATVSKLAYYETTRPTWRTVMAVTEQLGMLEEVGQLMIAYGKERKSSQ